MRLLGFDSVKEASGDAVKLLLTHPTMPWVRISKLAAYCCAFADRHGDSQQLRQSTAEELLGVYGEGGGEDSELEAAVLNIPWWAVRRRFLGYLQADTATRRAQVQCRAVARAN